MKYKLDEKQLLLFFGDTPLTGTSSVVNVLAKPLTWWASGLACEKFGWLNPKKNSPESVKIALQEGWERIRGLSLEAYEKLLGEAYNAHSKTLKSAAKKGTDLHDILERFTRAEIKRYKLEKLVK